MASQTLEQICIEQPTTPDKTPKTTTQKKSTEQVVERAQWLRAAVLGANDGLLSTTSLLLGIGAAKEDRWSMALAGLAGAFAGACSMAVGEFVSVSTQRDIEERHYSLEDKPTCPEYSRVSTPGRSPAMRVVAEEHAVADSSRPVVLPNPHKAAAASALAFLSGSVFPLVPAALVVDHATRIVVIVVVATLVLAVFGWVGALFGGSSPKASAVRVVVGGCLAMAVTYALLKPFDGDHGKKD
ncbi:vacuolar iron transporter homolog 4-like [Humulus lupulus]|uniref:vacuolar iron transporter homolog 4-like n=1 Tax=Humulus lupulus TaxID=3486 RepID=UPI002B40A99B|nr:vacuolar iron transporter homolog 4-like [Humulus lupulus]